MRRAAPLLGLALLACRDAADPAPLVQPSFLFVLDSGPGSEIARWDSGTVTPLTSNDAADIQPHVSGKLVVFTSYRDGGPEVYIASLDLVAPRRLTTTAPGVFDEEPALDPSRTQVAFVSTRSGVPRLWLMDTAGVIAGAIATGSATSVPERGPAWSPDGTRLAFSSNRSGASQIHVMDLATGAVAQVTQETIGAYDPEWMGSGDRIVYVASGGSPSVRVVSASGGPSTPLAGGTSGAQPSCRAGVCIAVRNPESDPDIALFVGDSAIPLAGGPGIQRLPAFIR